MLKIWCLAVAISASTFAVHADTHGYVVGIADGDTVTILTPAKDRVRVRLKNIDAPESKQAFGTKSKQNLAKYIFNKNVVIKGGSKDKYGRLLGSIYLNNEDINLKQVEDGMAWAYRQYLDDSRYIDAENRAKAARKGLWLEPRPVEPWNFRHKK